MVRRSLEQPPPRSRPRDAAVAPIVEEVDPAMAGEQRLRNTSAMLAIASTMRPRTTPILAPRECGDAAPALPCMMRPLVDRVAARSRRALSARDQPSICRAPRAPRGRAPPPAPCAGERSMTPRATKSPRSTAPDRCGQRDADRRRCARSVRDDRPMTCPRRCRHRAPAKAVSAQAREPREIERVAATGVAMLTRIIGPRRGRLFPAVAGLGAGSSPPLTASLAAQGRMARGQSPEA